MKYLSFCFAFIFFFLFLQLLANENFSEDANKPNIKIDKENREIQIQGNFNITKGILEFAAADDKTPRDYESLFLLNAKPSEIQNALKEIGLNPCLEKKDNCTALDIQISWQHNHKENRRKLIEFMQLNLADKKLEELQWLFTGSVAKEGSKTIAEDTNGEVLALQPNLVGIIHPNIDFGNPYDENKQKGFRVNELFLNSLVKENLLPKLNELKQLKIVFIIKPKEARKN